MFIIYFPLKNIILKSQDKSIAEQSVRNTSIPHPLPPYVADTDGNKFQFVVCY